MSEPLETANNQCVSPSPSEQDVTISDGPVPEIVSTLSEPEQQRLALIQELLASQGSSNYRQCQRRVAWQLGITVRSVRRMLQRYRQEGIASIVAQSRRDCGSVKISDDWQRFIVTTYQGGNQGGRSMTPAQVAVRVKVRAQELGLDDYPSHMTVYRLLQSHIEQQARQQQKRSIGWRGSRLTLKTRDGLEINVDYSNQAWQADHTKVDVLVVDQAG